MFSEIGERVFRSLHAPDAYAQAYARGAQLQHLHELFSQMAFHSDDAISFHGIRLHAAFSFSVLSVPGRHCCRELLPVRWSGPPSNKINMGQTPIPLLWRRKGRREITYESPNFKWIHMDLVGKDHYIAIHGSFKDRPNGPPGPARPRPAG